MRLALLFAVSLLSTFALAKPSASELSADMWITPKGAQTQKAKVFIATDKVRLEMNTQGKEMVMISDLSGKPKSFMLLPQQKMAMDLSGPMAQAMGGQEASRKDLRAMRDGNPCSDDESGTRTCKKLGTGKVDGRKATQWEISDKGEKVMTAWVDDSLHVLLKGEMPNGDVTELKNIKPGKQPDALFEVPKSYRMMDVGGMPPAPQK